MLVIIRSLGVMIRFLGDVLDCFGPKLVKKKKKKKSCDSVSLAVSCNDSANIYCSCVDAVAVIVAAVSVVVLLLWPACNNE
jgi:hypothetical protein